MREIAARYPVTYRRVGDAVAARGLNFVGEPSPPETRRIMLAIIAAMPPHVIPYGSMGDNTTWGLIDWELFLSSL